MWRITRFGWMFSLSDLAETAGGPVTLAPWRLDWVQRLTRVLWLLHLKSQTEMGLLVGESGSDRSRPSTSRSLSGGPVAGGRLASEAAAFGSGRGGIISGMPGGLAGNPGGKPTGACLIGSRVEELGCRSSPPFLRVLFRGRLSC